MKMKVCTPKTRAVALTLGIMWGSIMMLMTFISCYTGYGKEFLALMSGLYIGYEVSLMGSFVGFIYGFLDAFIAVYVFKIIYNFIYQRVSK